VEVLVTGLGIGESPRWHENRLWASDSGAQEIVAVDLDGNREVVVGPFDEWPTTSPFRMTWS
jgi:sugar lactone lactonase YvrE